MVNAEEDKIRVQTKIDELKKKRAGKILKLDVVVSEPGMINSRHALDEMIKICEMHKLIPDEVWGIGSQLQWLAQQVSINSRMQQMQGSLERQPNGMPNPNEKIEEKVKEKQEENGKEKSKEQETK